MQEPSQEEPLTPGFLISKGPEEGTQELPSLYSVKKEVLFTIGEEQAPPRQVQLAGDE